MLLSHYLAAGFLATTPVSLAKQIPFDHIMWGEKGAAGNHMIKRATTTAPSSSSTILSGSVAPSSSIATTSSVPPATCTNGPNTRACWSNGYSIATDFDLKWPNTGKTVSYNLEVTNTTCNPDGNGERLCMLYNNQFPGPTIRASECHAVKFSPR